MQEVNVTKVQRAPHNDWKSKEGQQFYAFDVFIEGDSVPHQYSAKSEHDPKITTGQQTVVITPSSGNYPPKIKPAAKPKFGGGGKSGDPKSFAASYAKDIAVACINSGIAKSTKEVDALIEHFYQNFLGKMQ